MAKSDSKIKARDWRKNGVSIKTIARDLAVSSSTVSLWCRDIKLTPQQIATLERQNHDPHYGRRGEYLSRIKLENDNKIQYLKTEAKKEVGNISRRDLFMIGSALYWAEGFKKDKMVGFANTDPQMILLILKWLSECLGVDKNMFRFRVVVNQSHEHRIEKIHDYWSNLLGFSMNQFYKPTFQKIVWSKAYDNQESYFGVLRIRVLKSTDLLRRIMGLIEGLNLTIAGVYN